MLFQITLNTPALTMLAKRTYALSRCRWFSV